MRTINITGGGLITYPELIVHAFSPQTVTVLLPTAYGDTDPVTITSGTLSFTRNCVAKTVQFPLNGIFESLFTTKNLLNISSSGDDFEALETVKSCDVKVYYNETDYETLTFTVLYGCIQFGETYTWDSIRDWYTELPFSVGVIGAVGNTLKIVYGAGSEITIGTTTAVGTNVFPDRVAGMTEANAQLRRYSGASLLETLYLTVNACTTGRYLRWVDRNGDIQYHMFKRDLENDPAMEFVSDGTYNYQPADILDSKLGRAKPIRKIIKKTLNIGEVDITEADYPRFEGLLYSPLICLYDTATSSWIGVNILDGSLIPTNSATKDFECTLALPEFYTQRL